VPSRGLTKLNEILEKTENYFHSQVTQMATSIISICVASNMLLGTSSEEARRPK